MTNMSREALPQSLRGSIAALRGTRPLAYLYDMSRVLRAVRLALNPARASMQSFPRQAVTQLLRGQISALRGTRPLAYSFPYISLR